MENLSSLDDYVHKCMSNGKFWSFWELKDCIKKNTGQTYGEPTISAAIRNLRKQPARIKYNLCLSDEVIVKKRIDGGKGYQYKLINYNYYNSEGMKNG